MGDIDVGALRVDDVVETSAGGVVHRACVVRATATQVVLDDGSRWNHYGVRVGARWHSGPPIVPGDRILTLLTQSGLDYWVARAKVLLEGSGVDA